MKVKTSELTGPALDWAAAKCEGRSLGRIVDGIWQRHSLNQFSTDWAQGGPIVEREGINLRAIRSEGHALHGIWLAMPASFAGTGRLVQWVRFLFGDTSQPRSWNGETALIAAMRCFVASRLGAGVDVPEELL
jgi:hypothetical protein